MSLRNARKLRCIESICEIEKFTGSQSGSIRSAGLGAIAATQG